MNQGKGKGKEREGEGKEKYPRQTNVTDNVLDLVWYRHKHTSWYRQWLHLGHTHIDVRQDVIELERRETLNQDGEK